MTERERTRSRVLGSLAWGVLGLVGGLLGLWRVHHVAASRWRLIVSLVWLGSGVLGLLIYFGERRKLRGKKKSARPR